MPGLAQKTLTGYFETEYASDWPGLVTNAPTSRIPPGAASACNAMVVRGRLQPQPAVFPVIALGLNTQLSFPPLAPGENVCKFANLQAPGFQGAFTVIITNLAVYIDFVNGTGTYKAFYKTFVFPAAYPRYAHFDTCVIGNKLYFSSASQRGIWCLEPLYQLATGNFTVEITNPGYGYSSAPTVTMSGGGGPPLTGTATIQGGQLTGITFTGTGLFTSAPTITLTGGLGPGNTGSVTNYNPSTAFPSLASATRSSLPGSVTDPSSPIVSGFPSVSASESSITMTMTVNGSIAIANGSNASGQIEMQASPDSGVTWFTLITLSSSSTVTYGSQNYTFGLPFTVVNINTIQLRLFVTATVGPPGGNVTVQGDMSNAFITVTQSPSLGLAYQGSAIVILNFPIGYTVVEVSANTGVQQVALTAAGGSYWNPIVLFQGGGGTGASAQVISTANFPLTFGNILGIEMTSLGTGYTSAPTVTIIDNVLNGMTPGTGATATAYLMNGQPFIGGDFMASMSQRLLLGNIIGGDGNTTSGIFEIVVVAAGTGYATAPTVSIVGGGGSGATATATLSGSTVGSIVVKTIGTGFTSAPQINILSNSGTGAIAYAVLTTPIATSSNTPHPDYVAWSAANAPAYFDPNNGLTPGGFDQITEARGLIASLNVVESVAFIGHNGGITEMTPNTSAALSAFSFYPLWSADKGVLVRYGSMAQYGTTLAFLAQDTAYMMTPGGLQEIGGNIADLLQNVQFWLNGNYPLQGLYGSIVLIEGQKHYLITLSSDDPDFQFGSAIRGTLVYDFNMSENSWHQWSYSATFGGQTAPYTATCAIYQSFDQVAYNPPSTPAGEILLGSDSWLLIGWTNAVGSVAPFTEQAGVYEITPFNLQMNFLALGTPPTALVPSYLNYQFRTESPSIARMQQERRIALEYENEGPLNLGGITPTPSFVYTGQQDPTTQTGTIGQVSASIPAPFTGALPPAVTGQIITTQVDFSTFTGVCTSLKLTGSGNNSLVSLVRITQVAELPKAQLP